MCPKGVQNVSELPDALGSEGLEKQRRPATQPVSCVKLYIGIIAFVTIYFILYCLDNLDVTLHQANLITFFKELTLCISVSIIITAYSTQAMDIFEKYIRGQISRTYETSRISAQQRSPCDDRLEKLLSKQKRETNDQRNKHIAEVEHLKTLHERRLAKEKRTFQSQKDCMREKLKNDCRLQMDKYHHAIITLQEKNNACQRKTDSLNKHLKMLQSQKDELHRKYQNELQLAKERYQKTQNLENMLKEAKLHKRNLENEIAKHNRKLLAGTVSDKLAKTPEKTEPLQTASSQHSISQEAKLADQTHHLSNGVQCSEADELSDLTETSSTSSVDSIPDHLVNHLANFHANLHEQLHGMKDQLYTTFTLISRLKTIEDQRHVLALAYGYRSMVPNYLSYNNEVVFRLTTSHICGLLNVDAIKSLVTSHPSRFGSLLDKVEFIDLQTVNEKYHCTTKGLSVRRHQGAIRLTVLDDSDVELDSVDASFIEELMPDQVTKLISSIEHHHKPSDENSVTVVAAYVKHEDGTVKSLFKYIAGQLDEDECPCITNKTSAVRTVHLLNDTLHDAIVQHCEKNLLSNLCETVATKWRNESPLFAVTYKTPTIRADGTYNILGIDHDQRTSDKGYRMFRYAHPSNVKLNFDIREPASPTLTEIGLGDDSNGSSFNDTSSPKPKERMNPETTLLHQQEHKHTIHALRENYHRPAESSAQNGITVIVSTTTGPTLNENPKKAVFFVDGIVHHFGHVQGSGNVGWLLSFSWLYSSALQAQLAQAWSGRVKSSEVKAWPAIASLRHPNVTENIKKKDMKTPNVNQSEDKEAKIRCGSLTITTDGQSISAENSPTEDTGCQFKTIRGDVISLEHQSNSGSLMPTSESIKADLLALLKSEVEKIKGSKGVYDCKQDLILNAHKISFPPRVEKMSIPTLTDHYFVLAIGNSSDIEIPAHSCYDDVLYRWDCVTIESKSHEITDDFAKKCVGLIIEHWNGMSDTLTQAKGMVIHVDSSQTKTFFPGIDKEKNCMRYPSSSQGSSSKRRKVPIQIWTSEPNEKALPNHIKESDGMKDWLKANPNHTSQDLSNFVENHFPESQLPTAFKYPVIHFKLIGFPIGLCQLGTTSGRSVTQLYLSRDDCAHFKFAQPGTDARRDTAGAENVLISHSG